MHLCVKQLQTALFVECRIEKNRQQWSHAGYCNVWNDGTLLKKACQATARHSTRRISSSLLCSFYEWSDVTHIDSNIEMKNLDSNEMIWCRANQMETQLIRVEISRLYLSRAASRHFIRRMSTSVQFERRGIWYGVDISHLILGQYILRVEWRETNQVVYRIKWSDFPDPHVSSHLTSRVE